MAFGISQSVRSREVQVCTPELFHQATKSSRVKDVCAQIEDALERKRRGEIGQEDYDTMKTRLKSQLPILTPHATFRNGRRLNADAIPSGLSIYDKDHIADPTGWWKAKSEELRVKNPQVMARILLVHVTPSLEGLRLVFVMPEGMNLAEAQKWMSQQLGDEEYDVCVKDLARPSFIVPEEYILFIDEARLFAEVETPSDADDAALMRIPTKTLTTTQMKMKTRPKKNIDLRAIIALLLFLLVLLLSMPSLLIMIVLMIIISAIMEWIKIMAERRSNKTSPKNTTESPTRR